MVYSWKSAARIKADAQKAGELFEQLERSGELTPAKIVEVSRSEDAALHDEFEWDDSIAANCYREGQAGNLLRAIIITDESKTAEPVRAFFKVEQNTYESITAIVKSEDKVQLLLSQAISELNAFQRKYDCLRALLPNVFAAIEKEGKECISA